MPNGGTAPDFDVYKLEHELQDPSWTVDMVPGLVDSSLLSTRKLASAGYIKIYDGKEVNIYDSNTTKIIVSEEAVLKGWRCPKSTLWRIPITSQVKFLNTDILILEIPDGQHSLNYRYEVSQTYTMLEHLATFMQDRPPPRETMNNVYKLPIIEPDVQYLHGSASFPNKCTWLKATRKGNYLSWPFINIKNVSKFSPESE